MGRNTFLTTEAELELKLKQVREPNNLKVVLVPHNTGRVTERNRLYNLRTEIEPVTVTVQKKKN